MRVYWSRNARRQLYEGFDSIVPDDPGAAHRMLLTLDTAASRLASFAERGRPGCRPNTREIIVTGTPFILPYRIRGHDVAILAVLHAARRRWPETKA
ncbi:MAG: type II toxin-antitoxin system RelE/ParE family toxin [Pseudomonadota bacterium]